MYLAASKHLLAGSSETGGRPQLKLGIKIPGKPGAHKYVSQTPILPFGIEL